MWLYSSSAPHRAQIAAAPGGGQSGLGSPLSIELTFDKRVRTVTRHPRRETLDAQPECVATNRASLTTSVDWLQGRPISSGSSRRRTGASRSRPRSAPRPAGRRDASRRRGSRRAPRRRAPSTPGCGGGPPGRWRDAPPRTRPGTRHPSVSQRRSVRSPMPQRVAACPIVGSDRSARIACSRTASVLAPWPAPDVRPSAAICGRLDRLGGDDVTIRVVSLASSHV